MIFADKKFSNPIKIIEAFDSKSFREAFSQIEQYRHGAYLLGYIRYEAKDIFLGKEVESEFPLLYFEVFDKYEKFEPQFVSVPALKTEAVMSFADYSKALREIKNQIALGNTYEVNYTYDHKVVADCGGFELYQALLANQTTPYNAYIKNQYEEILSFSPELFFELKNGVIRTKPMKGTIARGDTPEIDEQNIEFLQNDVKNRAENVMIVDLLRNDLSIIAKTGTVRVDKLFEIETHKTLHQMTSEISAEVKDGTSLYDLFEAIFPCGSITGAPKINTMEIIDRLEVGKRNVYCGAIGLISGDSAIFSVPIRILQKSNSEKAYSCRVGGAIVWDSDIEGEWQETLTKIKFLEPASDFQLVETLLSVDGELVLDDLHFARMQKSAQELGFKFNSDILSLKPEKDGMVRVLLARDGAFEVQYLPLGEAGCDRVVVSQNPVDSCERLLYHKTTYRPWYDDSMAKIRSGIIYDEIFFNERGELTEGARSNILLEKDGVLYTPSLACGLLNGVLRQKLLQEEKITEKILSIEDLRTADAVFCINSVRGIVQVVVDFG